MHLFKEHQKGFDLSRMLLCCLLKLQNVSRFYIDDSPLMDSVLLMAEFKCAFASRIILCFSFNCRSKSDRPPEVSVLSLELCNLNTSNLRISDLKTTCI